MDDLQSKHHCKKWKYEFHDNTKFNVIHFRKCMITQMVIPIIPWCVLTMDTSEMWGMVSNSLWLNLVMRPLRCASTTDWFINMTWFHFGIQVINAYDSWYHDSSWGKVISLSVMFLWTLSLNSRDCCINPLFF